MATVAVIADAGAGAGLGHLSRSSALAAALRERGAEVSALGLDLNGPADRYGVQWMPAGDLADLNASAIVLDSYKATPELRASLRAIAPLVAFGDGEEPPTDVDLWIGDYVCLGPPYWDIAPYEPADVVRRVLVATGGGDVRGLGGGLAAGLAQALPDATIALVRGPLAEQSGPPGVELVSAPSTLAGELARSDLVVCAAGQTLLETLAVGLPAVAIAIVENQRRQLSGLARAGAVLAAADAAEAIRAAARLAGDSKQRHELARAARANVDGSGALQAADAVLALCAPEIRLRPATIDDAELLLQWRNDPSTRRFSFTKHEITVQEHRAWLTDRLSDPDTLLLIAIKSGRPIGQVRLGRDREGAEVHIGLAPTERGRGYGRVIIREAIRLGVGRWPAIERVFARIDRANEPSIRAFEAAGFRPDRTGDRFVRELGSAHNAAR